MWIVPNEFNNNYDKSVICVYLLMWFASVNTMFILVSLQFELKSKLELVFGNKTNYLALLLVNNASHFTEYISIFAVFYSDFNRSRWMRYEPLFTIYSFQTEQLYGMANADHRAMCSLNGNEIQLPTGSLRDRKLFTLFQVQNAYHIELHTRSKAYQN